MITNVYSLGTDTILWGLKCIQLRRGLLEKKAAKLQTEIVRVAPGALKAFITMRGHEFNLYQLHIVRDDPPNNVITCTSISKT